MGLIGWLAGVIVILGAYLVGDKNIWGFVFGTVGNALWVYIGITRNKQYDLACLGFILTIINLVGLFKWMY
ncbi:MAG: hypothetical protein Q7S43_00575 [bacterium]|nr:hypothetical protein [bacterium]